jgi:hypothetical protein
MNRRSFLSMLGMASAVATNASLLGALLKTETDADYYRRMRAAIPIDKQNDLVGGWVSYKFKYTMTPPPPYRLRNVELPSAQVIDGHNIVRRPYVRGQQVELV